MPDSIPAETDAGWVATPHATSVPSQPSEKVLGLWEDQVNRLYWINERLNNGVNKVQIFAQINEHRTHDGS